MYYTLFPTELQAEKSVIYFCTICIKKFFLIVYYDKINQNAKKSLKLLLTNYKKYDIINTTKGKDIQEDFP